MMAAGDRASPLAEPLEAEHFATNRTDELLTSSIPGAAEETTQNCCWSLGRDRCCHVTYSSPKMCRPRRGLPQAKYPFYASRRNTPGYRVSQASVARVRVAQNSSYESTRQASSIFA